MIIGGLQKLSLIEYPGKTCAVIFSRGCNFRCNYCHNSELVVPEKYASEISLVEIDNFLRDRVGKLDAVCISGGEPTVHDDLPEFIASVKGLGFLVKLDTNGARPEMLAKLFAAKLLDYCAMDVKAPLENYQKIAGRKISIVDLQRSIELIKNSGIDHEFRTTVVKSLLSKNDLGKIAQVISGAQKYFLQKFVATQKVLDQNLVREDCYSDLELQELAQKFQAFVGHCEVR